MLIHSFWLVNALLLMAFGTAFYAIMHVEKQCSSPLSNVQEISMYIPDKLSVIISIKMKLTS